MGLRRMPKLSLCVGKVLGPVQVVADIIWGFRVYMGLRLEGTGLI